MLSTLLVSCALGFGSATAITPTTFVTASHVFAGDRCTVEGQEVEIVYDDPAQDILIGRVANPLSVPPAVVSCGLLETGKRYRLMGARRQTRAVATETYYDVRTETAVTRDMRGLRGSVSPGMSGGGVLNDAGEIVGVISSLGDGRVIGVREFATTQLCE
jgi:hypothetical protein